MKKSFTLIFTSIIALVHSQSNNCNNYFSIIKQNNERIGLVKIPNPGSNTIVLNVITSLAAQLSSVSSKISENFIFKSTLVMAAKTSRSLAPVNSY